MLKMWKFDYKALHIFISFFETLYEPKNKGIKN
jgi:hypothetical protein